MTVRGEDDDGTSSLSLSVVFVSPPQLKFMLRDGTRAIRGWKGAGLASSSPTSIIFSHHHHFFIHGVVGNTTKYIPTFGTKIVIFDFFT